MKPNISQSSLSRHSAAHTRTGLNMALLFIACISIAIASCGDGGQKTAAPQSAEQPVAENRHHVGDGPTGGQFIPIDSANKMIESYLLSIDAAHEDSELHAVIFDADTLRAYLGNTSIKKVKVMFAHTLNYCNSGHSGQPCEYNDSALTLIIAGYDTAGNYVYYPQNGPAKMVIDRGAPCPSNCPKKGTASNDVFSVNSTHK